MHACVALAPLPGLRRSPTRPPAACLPARSEFSFKAFGSRRRSCALGWLGGFNACLLPIHGAGRGGAAQPALPSLIQLSSPSPSAAHSCMVTFPLALGVQSLCVTGFEACIACFARFCMKRRSQERTMLASFLLLPSAVLFLFLSPPLTPIVFAIHLHRSHDSSL